MIVIKTKKGLAQAAPFVTLLYQHLYSMTRNTVWLNGQFQLAFVFWCDKIDLTSNEKKVMFYDP